MSLIILCGVGWRFFQPMDIEADSARAILTGTVFVLFLPALVLQVMWDASVGVNSLRIGTVAAVGVLSMMLLAWGLLRFSQLPAQTVGALILAAAYPNATYLGLPVQESLFGNLGRSVAIQYDYLACTPLLFTLGLFVAQRYGKGRISHPLIELAKVPAIWALLLAVVLNVQDVAKPDWLESVLGYLSRAVVPLMLLSLGLSLRFESLSRQVIPWLVPVVGATLIVAPLVVWGAAMMVGLNGDILKAAVLEAAMPSMVIGLVICDQTRLNTSAYAGAVTVSTALSMVTLPLWFDALS